MEEQGTEKSSPYPNGLSRLSRANKPNREDWTKVLPVLFFAIFTYSLMKERYIMELLTIIVMLVVAKYAFAIGWQCLQGALELLKKILYPSSTSKDSKDSKES